MYKNQTIWPYHNKNTQICNTSVHVRSNYFPMTMSQKTYNTSNKINVLNAKESSHHLTG